jgi:DNA-binding transcriptional ArsR family regulator
MAQRVMDLTGRGEGLALRVDAAPAHEFLVSLCAFALPHEHATLESGPAWFENTRARASRNLLHALDSIGPRSGKAWVNFLGLATQAPAVRRVPDLLVRIGALSPMDVRLYLMGYHVPAYQGTISREVLRRGAEGDRDAMRVLINDCDYYGGEAGSLLAPLLSLSAERTKVVAMEVLSRWYDEVFRHDQDALAAVLDRDAEAKRAMLGTVTPAELIESASGIQYVPRPDIRQVYLIPQVAMRPWVLLCEHDDTRLFCYPVADESLGVDPDAPPARLVRIHRALGDEKRIRMLRAIATTASTLQELSDLFDVPKSSLHHHLAILRAAGLVRVTSDLDRRYSIRYDVIPEASGLLDAYLRPGRGASPGPAGPEGTR